MLNPLKLIFRPNPDGTASTTTTMSSASEQRIKEIGVPAKKIVPIIFIPGIMGTNLWNTRTEKIAWMAPNTDSIFLKLSALGTAIAAFFSTAKDRQNDLDASDGVITVYQDGPIGSDGLLTPISKEELKRRGWGGIMRSAYHPIMVQMQNEMNTIKRDGKLEGWWEKYNNTTPADWGDWSNNPSLNSLLKAEGMDHASEIRYEVWAAGYNWLQSNIDSAKNIMDFIDNTVLPSYSNAERVIIVTHSMGGLVARAMIGAHKYSKIYGIVHGAMPATGAPAAYRRIRAGFEGDGFEGAIASQILGPTAAETTAVLSYSRGGLELLPSAVYNKKGKWLFARKKHEPAKDLIALPTCADPYNEIYKSDKWWGLIPKENEKLIDPNEFYKTRKPNIWGAPSSKRKIFEKNIDLVKVFHGAIAEAYHDETYVHYAADATDQKLVTWNEIEWRSDWIGWGDLESFKITSDDHSGNIELDAGFKFSFAPKISPGDGTVPVVSSASSRDYHQVKAAFAHGKNSTLHPDVCKTGMYNNTPGYDHQSAYNDPDGRTLYATLYSIVRISKNVQIKL